MIEMSRAKLREAISEMEKEWPGLHIATHRLNEMGHRHPDGRKISAHDVALMLPPRKVVPQVLRPFNPQDPNAHIRHGEESS
jgi:hypothetical protein